MVYLGRRYRPILVQICVFSIGLRGGRAAFLHDQDSIMIAIFSIQS